MSQENMKVSTKSCMIAIDDEMFGASAMARSHAGLNHHSDWVAICASIAA